MRIFWHARISYTADKGLTPLRAWFYGRGSKPARQESFNNLLMFGAIGLGNVQYIRLFQIVA
jgi:hypothetical protein